MAELVPVILAFKKTFNKTSTTTAGDTVTVTGNVTLRIHEDVRDHFNIPEAPAGTGGTGVKTIEAYTYTRIIDFTDGTGKTISVPEHERSIAVTNSVGKVVRLRHATLQTARKRPRTGSIRFPGFFNLIMIGQALGSMIKANNPGSYKLENTGRSYPLVLNSSADVFTGYLSGAWLVSAPVTAVNAEETSQVAGTTVVSGKADAKSNAPATPPAGGT